LPRVYITMCCLPPDKIPDEAKGILDPACHSSRTGALGREHAAAETFISYPCLTNIIIKCTELVPSH